MTAVEVYVGGVVWEEAEGTTEYLEGMGNLTNHGEEATM